MDWLDSSVRYGEVMSFHSREDLDISLVLIIDYNIEFTLSLTFSLSLSGRGMYQHFIDFLFCLDGFG